MDQDNVDMIKVDMKNLYILSSLPSCLVELYCGYNQLSQLPALPATLRSLHCPHNRLTRLPSLPALTTLDITSNHLVRVRPPETLVKLYCSFNPYLQMGSLPETLQELHCCNNNLVSLCLPSRLDILYCSYNRIEALTLPPLLKELHCDHNLIKRLVLPTTLCVLDCVDNRLTSLSLPPYVHELNASHNQITRFTLNTALVRLNLASNPLRRTPRLHPGLIFVNLYNTLIEDVFDFEETCGLYIYGTPLHTKIKAVLHTDRLLEPFMIKLAFDKIARIEDRFRDLYYGCKLKDPLLAWLWRARETLARRKYHPDELIKVLDQGYDALEGW